MQFSPRERELLLFFKTKAGAVVSFEEIDRSCSFSQIANRRKSVICSLNKLIKKINRTKPLVTRVSKLGRGQSLLLQVAEEITEF
jgi:hypothetical protein